MTSNRSDPTVSIVLPVYNGEPYLRQTLDSCLQQSYEDFELICVDDGSTDRSPEILRNFASRNSTIRFVQHEENRNLPNALNTGFDLALGRYFTWTSDDNFYHPEAIEKMVSFLDENEEVDLVYAGYRRIDEEGNEVVEVMPEDPKKLFSRNIIGPCFLHRREVYSHTGGYRAGFYLAEDYDFWIRAAVNFHLEPLEEILYTYRLHQSSLSQTQPVGVMRARRRVLADLVASDVELEAAARARAYLSMAINSAKVGDSRRARRELAVAFAARPVWALRNTPRFLWGAAILGTATAKWLRKLLDKIRS